jgi:lysophospholipase L1-like esterase
VRALGLAGPPLLALGLLGGIEALVRHLLPRVDPLEAFVRAPEDRANLVDRRRVRIFAWDPLLFWRLQPNLRSVVWDFTLVSTNAEGFRYPRPVGPWRPRQTRILCLGDSVTFGYRVPTVFGDQPPARALAGEPYPRLLEERLRSANPGREIEVIPMAVPGYSSYQGLLWLRRDIGRLHPDLVIALFGWNDVSLRDAPDRVSMADGALRVALRRALASSQALLRLRNWAAAGRRAPRAAPLRVPRVSAEEFADNHLELARLCRSRDARILVVGPVYRDDREAPAEARRIAAHRDALRSALAAAGVPYLEVPELTESSYPATVALFGERIHPDALGHRVLSDAVLQAIAARHLLPGIRVPAPGGASG